jgi:hypothetical protein
MIVLLALSIAASGCAQQQSGTGVVIEEFSAADTTLNPNQQTRIKTTIVNYNEAPTTIDSGDIELFNTGQLENLSKSCNPETIGASREGLNPTMACSWTVEAPDEDFVEGFESKPLSIKMRLPYESTLENEEALKINFQDVKEIESSSKVTRSVSNGDISATITSQSPATVDTPQNLNIEVSNSGPGSVEGSYSFSFSPDITDDCPDERDPIQGEAQLNCLLEADSQGARNLFASISYKYEKSPNLDIEVVNN